MFAPPIMILVKIVAWEFGKLEGRLLGLENYWRTVYLYTEWTNTSVGVKHD